MSAHSLASLEALAGQEAPTRFAVLRGIFEFIRSLPIDRHELMELSRLAVALFSGGFTMDKFWAFVDALLAALDTEPNVGGANVAAVDWESVFAFLHVLLDLLARFLVKEEVA
jgi:hypothetical protein